MNINTINPKPQQNISKSKSSIVLKKKKDHITVTQGFLRNASLVQCLKIGQCNLLGKNCINISIGAEKI